MAIEILLRAIRYDFAQSFKGQLNLVMTQPSLLQRDI